MTRWYSDNRGVFGLPLRFVVTLIVGGAALGAVVGFMLVNSPDSDTLVVSASSLSIEEGLGQTVEFTVTDDRGMAVSGATVTCTGCGTAASGKTDSNGKVTLSFDPLIQSEYRNEDFLDVTVSAPGFNDFSSEDWIQVTEADYSTFMDAIEDYVYDELEGAEKLDIEDFIPVDSFPIGYNEGDVQRRKMDVYVLDPEVANKIPDEFYISFQGDGWTNFHYKVVEVYGQAASGPYNFPDTNEIDNIKWEMGT
jgi:hypothetical protein